MIDFALAAMTVLFVLGLFGAEAIGRRLAGRTLEDDDRRSGDHARIGHILTSIFGLLALLVGFSFSISLDRYESRRTDVVEEANAIGTAHYRASFLGEMAGPLRGALEDYARHRTVYGRAGETRRALLEVEARRLRQAIATAGLRLQPVANTPLGASTVVSVNAVLDLGVQREANMRAKLPWTVFALLISLSLFGAGVMGLAYPGRSPRRRGSSLLLFALLALAINVIIDLDRPAGGGIAVAQAPMLQLVRDLGSDGGGAGAVPATPSRSAQ